MSDDYMVILRWDCLRCHYSFVECREIKRDRITQKRPPIPVSEYDCPDCLADGFTSRLVCALPAVSI